jgi:hypothetical protein
MDYNFQELQQVIDWAKCLGLGRPNDRLHALCRDLNSGAPLANDKQLVAHLFKQIEAAEFIDVWRAFQGDEGKLIVSKLKTALGGRDALSEESAKNNKNRNMMFELALAARLRRRGILVELGEPDLLVKLPEGQYVLECKRPFSLKSVKDNIGDAASQLRANLRKGQHGVIVISLSRAINPGDKALVVEAGPRNAQGAVMGTQLAHLENVSRELMQEVAKTDFCERLASLWFENFTPQITENSVGVGGAFHIYDASEPKVIAQRIFRSRVPVKPAHSYFKRIMGRAMNASLSLEELREIREAQRQNTSVLGVFDKSDPTKPHSLILDYPLRGR